MKERAVVFSEQADSDLLNLFIYIADHASEATAMGYVERPKSWCARLGYAPQRGSLRDGLPGNVRVVGFESRATIVFKVNEDQVTIARIFGGGRDWSARDLPQS